MSMQIVVLLSSKFSTHIFKNICTQVKITTYRKLGSTSTGTSIRRLRKFAVRIAWGTYNHGVLFNVVKSTVVQQHAH